jgi:uncharacterized protein (TIGR02001 family)
MRLFNAMLERGAGGSSVMRLLALVAASSLGAAATLGATATLAADRWGGSVSITSDYLVRGVSRSDNHGALQGELHYASSSGVIAGLFSSSAQIDSSEPVDVELSPFLGYAWTSGSEWHGKILASHYAYPWNHRGSHYDYDELAVDVAFQNWLDVSLVYSPNSPRFLPCTGLISSAAESAEVNLQLPLTKKLFGVGGVGYAYQSGPEAAGYVYWSVGAAYDLAPWSITISYVDTSAAAKALFYNAAAENRWLGTVIWRF